MVYTPWSQEEENTTYKGTQKLDKPSQIELLTDFRTTESTDLTARHESKFLHTVIKEYRKDN